jgi:hypothetical protein
MHKTRPGDNLLWASRWRCALVSSMASLAYYERTFGKIEGRNRYNAFHREYKKKNRTKINAARRAARRAHKQRA